MTSSSTGLSLNQAPPFSVPLRFFLTAPLFGILFAVGLSYYGEELMVSRFHHGVIALSHVLVLGVLVMVMFGAMFQMLPVMAGSIVPRVQSVATWVHLSLLVGTLTLVLGLIGFAYYFFMAAMLFLTSAILIFLFFIFGALQKAQSAHESVRAMKIACVALFFTLLCGLGLLLGHLGVITLMRPFLTNLHLIWGIGGWVSILIMGVSYHIVPMFQITKPYPLWVKKFFTPLILSVLLLLTAAIFVLYDSFTESALYQILVAVLLLFCMVFFVITFWLQHHRKRKITDVSLWFWRLALGSGLVAGVLGFLLFMFPELLTHYIRSPELVMGVLLICGFPLSLINGMLYKIVPFLTWFHLQGKQTEAMLKGQTKGKVPHMKEIISDKAMKIQFAFVVLGLVALVTAAVFSPVLVFFASVAYLVAFILLANNIFKAYKLFYSLA